MSLKEVLEFYGITSIWHFTDRSNLESIKENGLLSLEMLRKYSVNVSCYGANELSHNLDTHYGLDKYIYLSIIKDHPMQYIKQKNGEIPNLVWLEIDTSVLFENESRCCNQVANSSNAECYDIEKIAEVIDLTALLNNPHWSNPVRKSELLVANRIDYSKIKGVHCG
ncbi:MAG: DUF4433 domain-containing protein [Campylobacterales bacterium]|nr:DUF4433 domain-containing protein [Campylobacterales bacterium]